MLWTALETIRMENRPPLGRHEGEVHVFLEKDGQ